MMLLLILDNHSVPLSWAVRMNVTGSLFYDLEGSMCELDIRGLCNSYAQSREREMLPKLIKKSPYFPPTTWQERALEILNSDDDD